MKPNQAVAFFTRKKKSGRRISAMTAYDAPTAAILKTCGVDIVLVGDSVATVLCGYKSTIEITLDEMLYHARAARRGAPRSFIVGDMPLDGMSGGARGALRSALCFVREGGSDAVKIEWSPSALAATRRIVRAGIPVMGHTGLTPQRAKELGGLKVQGTTPEAARAILDASLAFEDAGAFAVVLECIPEELASLITQKLKIPTIGIGAGRRCDGQVLVFHDAVGLTPHFRARFVKRYAHLHANAERAVRQFVKEVRTGRFPAKRHTFQQAKERR